MPFTRQYSGGASYQFPFDLTVDADVIYSQGEDGIVSINDNVALVNGAYVTPDARFSNINHYRNQGWTRYKALLRRRGTGGAAAQRRAPRTRSRRTPRTTPRRSRAARRPTRSTSAKTRDRTTPTVGTTWRVNGSYILPFDFQISGIYTYRSALPYNVTTSAPTGHRPVHRSSGAAELAARRPAEEPGPRVSKIVKLPKGSG